MRASSSAFAPSLAVPMGDRPRDGRTWEVVAVLRETQDAIEIVPRIAVLDVGKAEVVVVSGCRARVASGRRRW